MNKELEALEIVKDRLTYQWGEEPDCAYELETIKSALELKEKLERAWKTIKEKNPRLSLIKSMIRLNCVDFEDYDNAVFDYELLTEAEFNLLKEMLEE